MNHAKQIEQIKKEYSETLCGKPRQLNERKWNCLITRPCKAHESQKEIQEYIYSFRDKILTQAVLYAKEVNQEMAERIIELVKTKTEPFCSSNAEGIDIDDLIQIIKEEAGLK